MAKDGPRMVPKEPQVAQAGANMAPKGPAWGCVGTFWVSHKAFLGTRRVGLLAKIKLYIFGAGHLGPTLTRLGAIMSQFRGHFKPSDDHLKLFSGCLKPF